MEVPQQIGPYEVVREIGRGGMGVVYLAREPEDGTLVALKVLPETCSPDKDSLERFRREAATVMKVRHPNVVPIYSVGCANGTWFIAMKFIEGTSLDGLLDDRFGAKTSRCDDRTVVVTTPEGSSAVEAPSSEADPVSEPVAGPESAPQPESESDLEPEPEPVSESAADLVSAAEKDGEFEPRIGPPISWIGSTPFAGRIPAISFLCEQPDVDAEPGARSTEPAWVYRGVLIVEKIARALDYLHAQGIVHRDVKPGNIIVDRDGEPWLVDFGLVRDLLARRGPKTEGIVGTFQYMAPEQAGPDRDKTDGRCDIYALGVTLYEIATLERPFDGDDPKAILRDARHAPIPPRKLNPRITKAFQGVILKAMARNPADRYQTGNALADDLERLRTVGMKPPPAPFMAWFRRLGGKHPRLTAAVAVLTMLVVGLAGWCIEGAVNNRARVLDCRIWADEAFDRQDFRAAANGYRLYLRLGGSKSETILARLQVCEDASVPSPR